MITIKKIVFILLSIIPYVGICLDNQRIQICGIQDLVMLLFDGVIGYPLIAYCITEFVWYFMGWLK